MTKLNTTLSAVITFENASENGFADNYVNIYKPFFTELKKRIAYFDQQKGVKGANDMKLAYDVKHGIRNKQGEFCFNPAKPQAAQNQFLTQAAKYAAMPENELLALAEKLGGNTIGTLYKNQSNEKTRLQKADKKPAGKKGKQASKPEKSDADKKPNIVLSSITAAINGIPADKMNSALFANILIGLADVAAKQYDNCEAKQIRAILENPAMAQKLAKSA